MTGLIPALPIVGADTCEGAATKKRDKSNELLADRRMTSDGARSDHQLTMST